MLQARRGPAGPASRLAHAAPAMLVGLAVSASVAVAPNAEAAVRYCAGPVAGEATDATSERAARKKALDAWRQEAGRLGARWTSWRLATPRAIRCAPRGAGGWLCRAVAAPCIISQNPEKVPDLRPGTEI